MSLKSGQFEQLSAAYPRITHAIAWVELMIHYPGDCPWNWAMGKGVTPIDMVEAIRDSIDQEDYDAVPRSRLAKAEMADPSFLQYVAGKMGAV